MHPLKSSDAVGSTSIDRFFGSTETGMTALSIEWAKTSLGDPSAWPVSLKVTVGILLRNRHPMLLFWGDDNICFYNDAFMVSLGKEEHPLIMGKRGVEALPEMWDTIGPQVQSVKIGGDGTWHADHRIPLRRHGGFVEAYWTYSCSPALDELSEVAGVLLTITETTLVVEYKKQLQKSEERLKSATLATGIGVWEHDLHTGKIWATLTHDRHYGYQKQVGDWCHEKLFKHIHPDDRTDVQHEMSQAFQDSRNFKLHFRVFWEDGSEHWLAVSGRSISDASGTPIKIIGTTREITDEVHSRQRLEQAKEDIEKARVELNSVLDAAPFLILRIDSKERYIFQNKTTLEHFGEDAPRLGMTVLEFIGEKDYREIESYIKSALQGEKVTYEWSSNLGMKGLRTYLVTYTPERGRDGSILGMVAGLVEITDMKAVQDQFERAKEMAEEATREKSNFLANMSHEIRTPLCAILGFSNLLKTETKSESKEKYADIISRNGKLLTTLIDDIIDLSKVESGRFELEHIDFCLDELIEETRELFQDRFRQKNIGFIISLDPNIPKLIRSDPTRIKQILINLIGNAIKFTPDGTVTLELSSQAEGDAGLHIIFTVRDTGIGMTEAQALRVFEPFTQADSSMTRHFGGSGLGLGLSRRLAMVLGGDVRIERSIPKVGSTFVITVKAEIPGSDIIQAHRRKGHAIADSLPIPGLKILLVEDAPDNQFLIKELLTQLHMTVDIANNGAEGIERAKKTDYDIVLMDMQMPVLDGYSATRMLREDDFKTPIFALTASVMEEERSLALEAGCDAYLTKPLDIALLLSKIKEWVQKK